MAGWRDAIRVPRVPAPRHPSRPLSDHRAVAVEAAQHMTGMFALARGSFGGRHARSASIAYLAHDIITGPRAPIPRFPLDGTARCSQGGGLVGFDQLAVGDSVSVPGGDSADLVYAAFAHRVDTVDSVAHGAFRNGVVLGEGAALLGLSG